MGARVVCFGEMLLRLSAPPGEILLQSPRLDARFGGAEANVAVSLAILGQDAAVTTVLPRGPLGRAARDELRRHGVDAGGVRFAEGRMGLYFLAPGAGLRASEVTYDRAGSAFAQADPALIDWDRELDGADWLHLSGVTLAVGPAASEAAVRGARAARRLGVRVSFDGNHRSKLWAGRLGEAPAVIGSVLRCAELAFIEARDIALVLGTDFAGLPREERAVRAARAAFDAFPELRRVASTVRVEHAADVFDLSAELFTTASEHRTDTRRLSGVVDRIGAGDAFAAGVLHGLIEGWEDAAALQFGWAAACLKHSVVGDFNLADADEIQALAAGGGLDVKR